MKLLKWRWQWNKDHKKGEVSMKKVLPFMALVGLLLLSGCGTDMKKILTADGGKWEVDEGSSKSTYTFFDDGKFSVYDSKDNAAGKYSYDEKNKKITFDVSGRGTFIMEKVEYKDGKINGEINDRETVFVKEK
ncbi:TPA: hypothetical protein IUV36_003065 [Enterococcus faecalis]|nr:hypothetical protein [Enterococcus faecalis]